jgi:hypothetical protein
MRFRWPRIVQAAQKVNVVVGSARPRPTRAKESRPPTTVFVCSSAAHEEPQDTTEGRNEADDDPEGAWQATNSGLVNQDDVDDGIDKKRDKNCDNDDECASHSELSLGSAPERTLRAVKKFPAWLPYTLMRLVSFIVPLSVLLALGVEGWLSALIAAIIGICVSYIFFARSRNAVAAQIHAARTREKPLVRADDAAEDAAVDGVDGSK